MSSDLCWNCKKYEEIAYTEAETRRAFCQPCALQLPPSNTELAHMFLALTVPFEVGDIVEARTGGSVLDGTGVIEDISTDLRDGGTNVYPSFRVRITEPVHDKAPEIAWYTEICLTKVEVSA